MSKRKSAVEVEALVRGFEASGLTRGAYSRQMGIAVATLDSWRRKRGKSARLVKVEVEREERAPFRLSLRNGRRIESEWSFADADLTRLIRIAESA